MHGYYIEYKKNEQTKKKAKKQKQKTKIPIRIINMVSV